MRRRATLGYHRPGDYYYFTVYRQGAELLGSWSQEPFDTHERFAGLVTAVHEHYHLMQEMLLGYSWWRHETSDAFIAEMWRALKTTGDAGLRYPLKGQPDEEQRTVVVDPDDRFSWAAKLRLELRNIDRYAVRPGFTRSLLDAEVKDAPDLRRFYSPEAYELTTLDLLECHAAVLTELYISKLIAEQPSRFNVRVAKELASLFRLDKMMEQYSRPLRILLHMMQACGIRLDLSSTGHPFYGQIHHGVVYLLLAFLLDYALHTPPQPLALLQRFPDGAAQQDIYPPFRFFNLALVYSVEAVRAAPQARKDLLTEGLYYKQVGPLLAGAINRMHGHVRPPGAPSTFFSIDETTLLWADHLAASDVCREFPETSRVRRNCWDFRRQHPDTWFELNPASFDLSVELPILVLTRKGLASLPFFADKDKQLAALGDAELKEYLQRVAAPHFQSMLGGGAWSAPGDVPTTLFPERFIVESMAREMALRLASAILFEGELRCPLTEAVGGCVPCASRTRSCEAIGDLQKLPVRECLLRETGERFLGRLGRFEKGT